jgi:aspartate/methionine/tyrosine aminotransferase
LVPQRRGLLVSQLEHEVSGEARYVAPHCPGKRLCFNLIKVFADRIGRIEVSATMAVAAEAAKLRAAGVNLVDFGAGEPHFPTPRHIKDAAIAAIEANFTRYTVVPGIPDVRKAIVERHACDFGSDYGMDEAIFTTGEKLALFNAIQVLVEHGDEVILPVPYWVSFKDIIQYAGGKVVYLETRRRRVSASRPTRLRRRLRRRPRRLF